MKSRFGNIRKLPSGRYQVRYDSQGERKKAPTTFPSIAAARKWLDRIEHEQLRVHQSCPTCVCKPGHAP